MEAVAHAKFVRYAPRKVNQVLALIRNKPVGKAFEILATTPKGSTDLIGKVLKSAVAHSGHLKNMSGLKIKECWVGQGPTLKRMRPGPMGRGMPYKRKTCHLSIVVSELLPHEAKKKKKKEASAAAPSVPAKSERN
jgi:large subunit ribosomal protein L22